MTWMDVAAPPPLQLPMGPVDNAVAALDNARSALKRAEDLEWVSTAADAYRAELKGIDVRMSSLAAMVDSVRDRWVGARIAARHWGQL